MNNLNVYVICISYIQLPAMQIVAGRRNIPNPTAKDKHMRPIQNLTWFLLKESKGTCILELHASDNGNKHSSLSTDAGIQQKKCESKNKWLPY